jgi:hypothetical protein
MVKDIILVYYFSNEFNIVDNWTKRDAEHANRRENQIANIMHHSSRQKNSIKAWLGMPGPLKKRGWGWEMGLPQVNLCSVLCMCIKRRKMPLGRTSATQ